MLNAYPIPTPIHHSDDHNRTSPPCRPLRPSGRTRLSGCDSDWDGVTDRHGDGVVMVRPWWERQYPHTIPLFLTTTKELRTVCDDYRLCSSLDILWEHEQDENPNGVKQFSFYT